MIVEVVYFEGCPHADEAHALVQSCIKELGIDATVIKREADHPSPTVRVSSTSMVQYLVLFAMRERKRL